MLRRAGLISVAMVLVLTVGAVPYAVAGDQGATTPSPVAKPETRVGRRGAETVAHVPREQRASDGDAKVSTPRPSRPRDLDSGNNHVLTPSNPAPVAPERDPNRVPASMNRAFMPECWTGGIELAECQAAAPAEPGAPAAPPAPPTRGQVESVVRTLVARLRLPDSVPQVGPDPSVNEWNMAVVGHPLWLWVEGPDRRSTSVSGYGVTIRMDARRAGLSFAMGDGGSVRCTVVSPYHEGVASGAPSPTCGYTYSKASLPKGDYTVTATAHWVIDWSAIGYSGTIPLDIADSRDLPVGELQAVVVRR